MADNPRAFVDRAAAAIAGGGRRDVVPPGRYAPAPAAGFRFAVGARVVDVLSGARARVSAAYPGAASNARVYELRSDGGALLVRLENQVEPWSDRT